MFSNPQAHDRWEAVPVRPGRPLEHTVLAGDRDDQDSCPRYWKLAVIEGHCACGLLHPREELSFRNIDRTRRKINLQRGAPDSQLVGGGNLLSSAMPSSFLEGLSLGQSTNHKQGD